MSLYSITMFNIFPHDQDPKVGFDTAMLFDRNTGLLKYTPTFEEFLSYILMDLPENSNDDPHWRPYKQGKYFENANYNTVNTV